MPSALVFDLAAHAAANRFTVRDRMELGRWAEIARERGFERLVVHERQEGDPADVGNYLAVYAAGCCWASWGLSRRQGGIVVWNSVSGLDRGRFRSMHEALAWVLERRADRDRRASCAGAERRASNRAARQTNRSENGPQTELPVRLYRQPAEERGVAKGAGLVEGVGFEPT